MSAVLERCVGDVERFTTCHWGVAPLRTHGADGDFDDLLSLGDVDRIITTTAPRRPAIRLVRDGSPIPPARYTRGGRLGGEHVGDLVDPGRVYDLFGEGATIVLQSLQRSWAPVSRFCRDLELALTHPVQANAYLTPAGAAGLAPHHDGHDVFVLQVHGRKRWVVHEPLVEAPLAHQRMAGAQAASQAVLFEAALEPGDVLYLPRGFVHAAVAQDTMSLHVTIGVLTYTMADVVHELVRQATDDEPLLRRSLPPGFADDPDALLAAVKTCAAALATWSDGADPARVAASLTRRFWSGRRPLLEGQLQQLAGLGSIGDATVVRRRPRAAWQLEPEGEELRLELGDRTIVMSAALGPAVRRLLSGSSVVVADLADMLDEPSRLVLVRRLVREGALLATGDATSGVGDAHRGG